MKINQFYYPFRLCLLLICVTIILIMDDLHILGVHEEEETIRINNTLPAVLRQTPEQAVHSARLQKYILQAQGKNCFDPDKDDYSVSQAIIYGEDESNSTWADQNPSEEKETTPAFEDAYIKYNPRTPAHDEDCSSMKRRKIDEEWRRLDKYREDVLADIEKARGHLAKTIMELES